MGEEEEDLEQQLEKVTQLLAVDPDNAEFQDMAAQLRELIQLSKELATTNSSPPDSRVSTVAPVRAAPLDNHHQRAFPPGTKVQAVWSEDGEWYNATIRAATPNGYLVAYDGWGNQEEVDAANIRELNRLEEDRLVEAEREAEATRQAIKRKIAQAADVDVVSRELPPKLKIKPDDPEEVRLAKKKKIHAFKSKIRLEQLEVAQNKRQNAWQQFQTNKGKAKKVGFFTGRKKESIFKSPDDPRGKVGVTGSGKGITEFQKREKHLHPKDGSGGGEQELVEG